MVVLLVVVAAVAVDVDAVAVAVDGLTLDYFQCLHYRDVINADNPLVLGHELQHMVIAVGDDIAVIVVDAVAGMDAVVVQQQRQEPAEIAAVAGVSS